MGLKVKHHAGFGWPDPVYQSVPSSSSCPQRRAPACTACALNLTNAEQDKCSRAAGLRVLNLDPTKDKFVVLSGFVAASQIRTHHFINTGLKVQKNIFVLK